MTMSEEADTQDISKLRLLITEQCPRSCEGCCNKDWDLDALPVCTDFSGYDEILLTGGEPMLRLDRVDHVLTDIARVNPDALTIMYTAQLPELMNVIKLYTILQRLKGVTVTLHEQNDVCTFFLFNRLLGPEDREKSLRLNVFNGVELTNMDLTGWKVKEDIEWIDNCPLPPDEILMRYSKKMKGTVKI